MAGFNPSEPTKGRYNVTEFLAEINVPVLKDVFLAETLEFNGAYRYSDYSTDVGGVATYAAGGQWATGARVHGARPVPARDPRSERGRAVPGPDGQLRRRDGPVPGPGGGRSRRLAGQLHRDGRPGGCSRHELWRRRYVVPGHPGRQSRPVRGDGSDTWTAGFVVQPSAWPNFVATVDYYNIKIDDVITTGVGAQNLVNACYLNGATQYCDLITRASTGEFENFFDTNVNAATLETEGVDVELGYNYEFGAGLPNAGGSNLAFRLNGTYVINNDFTPINGIPIVNECAGAYGRNCGAPDPEWRHSFRTTWSSGPATASLLWRYFDATEDDDPTFLYGTEELSAQSYLDLSLGWDFNENVSVGFGIDNLLDDEPSEKIASGRSRAAAANSRTPTRPSTT